MMNGWMNGYLMNGRIYIWMDGWMMSDGWIVGYIDVRISLINFPVCINLQLSQITSSKANRVVAQD